jgi:predicted SnoaL-like aldol condensation-catalyzing enzyme
VKRAIIALMVTASMAAGLGCHAQVAVQANPDQALMLKDSDAHLAANKRLVYDFWREVFEGGHAELASKYMTESYIQHNPNVPTGRAAFVDFVSSMSKPRAIETSVQAPLVAIVADGDYVILSFASGPHKTNGTYASTWFDMFRIRDGKIAEHWDPSTKVNVLAVLAIPALGLLALIAGVGVYFRKRRIRRFAAA